MFMDSTRTDPNLETHARNCRGRLKLCSYVLILLLGMVCNRGPSETVTPTHGGSDTLSNVIWEEWFPYTQNDDSLIIHTERRQCIGGSVSLITFAGHLISDTLLWTLYIDRAPIRYAYVKKDSLPNLSGIWQCAGAVLESGIVRFNFSDYNELHFTADRGRTYVANKAKIKAYDFRYSDSIEAQVISADSLLIIGKITEDTILVVFENGGVKYDSNQNGEVLVSREEVVMALASCDTEETRPIWFEEFLDDNDFNQKE